MAPSDYANALRRRWRWLGATVFLVVAAAAVVAVRQSDQYQYQSSVQFFISTTSSPKGWDTHYSGSLLTEKRMTSYARLVSGPQVAEAVADDVGSTGGLGTIAGSAEPDTVLLTATVTHTDPERAQQIAAAVGRAFPRVVETLETKSDGPAALRATVVAEPVVATDPVSPRPVRTVVLALVLGILLGIGLAVGRDALDGSLNASHTRDPLR